MFLCHILNADDPPHTRVRRLSRTSVHNKRSSLGVINLSFRNRRLSQLLLYGAHTGAGVIRIGFALVGPSLWCLAVVAHSDG